MSAPSRATWLTGATRRIHELQLPPRGGLLVLYRQGDSSIGRLIGPDEDLRSALASSGTPASRVLYARAFGGHSLLRQAAIALGELGIESRDPVDLGEAGAAVQYLPEEGRVRADKGAIRRPPAIVTSRPANVEKAPDRPKRVLIVDDSEPIRRILKHVLSLDPGIECVGAVSLPSQVAEAIQRLRPDVITMDLHMPEMNGVELIRRLLPVTPLPVVVISSLSREEGPLVLDALEAGAVDYIQKPALSELAAVSLLICEKVRLAASAQVNAPRPRLVAGSSAPVGLGELDLDWLGLIGSSTGGTEALREVLTALPERIPPLLIVQHIPPVFSKALADRLATLCRFEVREAQDGDRVQPSLALIAPGGHQMRVKRFGQELRVVVEDAPPVNRHKPSVDFLFDSVAELGLPQVSAAILTGMGADGAAGLARLRKLGARTLSQDEASSVVYGMPKEAMRLGGSERAVPLNGIARAFAEIWRKGSRRGGAK